MGLPLPYFFSIILSVQKEAKARIKINKLLEVSGWRFFDTSEGKANIQLESGIDIQKAGDDFEQPEGIL